MSLEPGRMLSHYRLVEKIGRGGMGVVYRARDEKLRRDVALKVLPPELAGDPERRRRLVHEARAAAAPNHPNIATVHEIDEFEGQVFFAMELVEGRSLRALLGGESLPLQEALRIAAEMAEGLASAHDAKLIHRDLKPENVMIRPDGHVKILDFGLAKVHQEQEELDRSKLSEAETRTERLTREGARLGTPDYMSPEQARGEAVDARSDVFSFGATLYEMVTGRPPFHRKTPMDTLAAIINTPVTPASQINTDVPPGLDGVLGKCLEKEASERYQSVAALIVALGGLKAATGLSRLRTAWRRRWPLALAAGVVLLLAVARIVIPPDPPPPAVSKNVIAVFPFTVRGGEEIEYLAEGMVDILVPLLDGAEGLRSIDSLALLKAVEAEGGGQLAQEQYQATAEHFGAGLYVLGTILNVGGELQISGTLYASADAAPTARATVRGDEEQLGVLAEDLAVELLVGTTPGPKGQQIRDSHKSTDSFPALKAFLQGEVLKREGRFYEAHEAYQRAVNLDPAFALAYYRDSVTVQYSPTAGHLSGELTKKAWELRDRLPAREQQTLEGWVAWNDGKPEEAIGLLRRAVGRHPDHVDGRWHLALALFHYGRRHNLGLDEVEQQLRRVLRDQPDHTQAVMWLLWLAALREDYAEAAHWAGRALELAPEGFYAPALRALLAFQDGNVEVQEAIVAELRELDAISTYFAFYMVAGTGSLEGAPRVARVMTEPSRSTEEQASGYRLLAHNAVARGRWGEARENLEAWEELDPARARHLRAALATTPLLRLPREELEAFETEVAGAEDPAVRHAYVTGLLNARLGDSEAALRRAAELDSLYQASPSGQLDWPDWAQDFAHTLRAEVARLEGDPEQALSEIAQVHPEKFYLDINPYDVVDGEAYPRYLKGVLLAESGNHDEAIRWYGSLGMVLPTDIVYLAPKHLRLGELFEKLGDANKAMHHYSRFVEIWKDCDPELRSLVDAASERMAVLAGEAPSG